MVVNTGVFVLFLLLSASWLSSARLRPGAEVLNAPSSASMKSSDDATASTIKSQQPAVIFGDENKSSKKVNVVETSLTLSSSSSSSSSLSSHNYNERQKRRLLRRHWSDEVDKGFVAFSADYHETRHHPPKHN